MKIYLDNNLGVTNVEQEELTQDTIGYNILKVYIPNAVLTPYNTFTCYYGALLQNGRKVGWFAMEARTSTDADYEANYTLYKATLEQCVVSVEGKVYIGCQVLLGNSGNATLIKKNTAVVQFNVRKSVAINNDILVLDTDQTTTDVLESYKNLLKNALTTYATKATTYTKTEVNSALALKADKSNTYTKTEVDGKLDLKADKSDTYTKAEVNETALDLYDKIDQTNISIGNLDLAIGDLGNRTTTLELDIADLESVQNVVDVVATKNALNSYDTSKLGIDDKVQVIADETHDGASTIYNWNGSAWQYVGAFGGNSYTKAETYNKTQIDSALSDKADKSDTYTRAVIDSTILTLSTDKADKSDVYTKTEEDAKFEEVGQAFEIVGNEVLKKADKTELDNAINNLRWELGSNTLDVESDTTTAYSKSVPSGAIGCQINKLGGMSYKSKNLLQLSDVADTTRNGITYKAENGVITLNGTAKAEVSISLSISLTLSGTYTLSAFNSFTITNSLFLITTEGNKSVYLNATNKSGSFTFSNATASQLIIYIPNGTTLSNDKFSPMLVSGSTAPTTYKPYFSGIRDSAVTSVVSKDSNDTTIDTITIPTAIQNLTGYGWGINDTCYNYIDFANKKFIQNVGRVDLGSLNYGIQYEGTEHEIVISSTLNNIKNVSSSTDVANILADKIDNSSISNVYNHSTDNIIAVGTTGSIAIYSSALIGKTANEIKILLSGITFLYELATPVETDISAYLTTDTIDVEPNGTLEFTNTYSQDVPSDIDYLIEEVKA